MNGPAKVSATLIRRLREDRAWSQEHLASCTGLSLRTIQRVESDGTASFETRLALAGALGLSAEQLVLDSGDDAPPTVTKRSPGLVLGTSFGVVAALGGLTQAWIAALSNGLPSGVDAGSTFGIMGALSGLTLAFVATIVGRCISSGRRMTKAGECRYG